MATSFATLEGSLCGAKIMVFVGMFALRKKDKIWFTFAFAWGERESLAANFESLYLFTLGCRESSRLRQSRRERANWRQADKAKLGRARPSSKANTENEENCYFSEILEEHLWKTLHRNNLNILKVSQNAEAYFSQKNWRCIIIRKSYESGILAPKKY